MTEENENKTLSIVEKFDLGTLTKEDVQHFINIASDPNNFDYELTQDEQDERSEFCERISQALGDTNSVLDPEISQKIQEFEKQLISSWPTEEASIQGLNLDLD